MSKKGRGGTKASGRSTMARGHGKGADRQVKQVRLFSWRALQIVMLLVLGGLLLTGCTSLQRQEEARLCSRCDPPPRGCTILTVSQGDRVFFGGNGDWINLDSNYYWVDPGSQVHYGAIYFGVPTNVQQGFNEKGLAYDSNGLPSAPVNSHPGRKPFYGSHSSYFIRILQECATVEEVIAWVQEHRWHKAMHYQMHFADADGDAVVISVGADGKLAFTRKPAGDSFLVSTNFNLANPANAVNYPCWRYTRAQEVLRDIDDRADLTAEHAASVLDAVHVESSKSWTILSLVGDLPRGLVYVYLFHQFDAPIVLNVAEETARAPDPGPLRDLFPPETVSRVDQAHQRLIARSYRCDAAGRIWLGLVIASLVVFFLLARSKRRGLAMWTSVVAVLGPAGLLLWLIATRRRAGTLVEAIGDLPVYVVGILTCLLALILVPRIAQSSLLQLLALHGTPLFAGLLLYQAPLLARATRSSYVRTVLRRLPSALISTNLALAGFQTVSLPLIKWHLGFCGFSLSALPAWWAIVVLGALAGGVLLYAYHAWAVRHGFVAWSALLWGTGETGDGTAAISSPPWRRLWPWIMLSFVFLVAGATLGRSG